MGCWPPGPCGMSWRTRGICAWPVIGISLRCAARSPLSRRPAPRTSASVLLEARSSSAAVGRSAWGPAPREQQRPPPPPAP
eukprot:8229448-Alexandrium_andersonii.AAC.1